MITLISKENVQYLLEKFNDKFTKDNEKTKQSVELLHYHVYGSKHSNGNAYPNHEILLSVHVDCAELTEPFYRFAVVQYPKKRIIITPMGEFDYEVAALYVYKVEVQELTAEDTTTGYRSWGAAANDGIGGTPPNYNYLKDPSDENPYSLWKEERNYDFALWHTWWNTDFRKQKLCKLKVGIVYNRKKGDFDNFSPTFKQNAKRKEKQS